MTGRELAERAQNGGPTLGVLFTTGYARNAIVHHGRLDSCSMRNASHLIWQIK